MEGDESINNIRSSFNSSKKLRDENISLKGEVERQGRQLADLTDRCRQLLLENQRLRENDGVPTRQSTIGEADNTAALQTRNEMLSKQSELLMCEIDEANAAIRLRDESLEALGMQVSELKSKVARLSADKQVAESRLIQRMEQTNEQQEIIDGLKLEVKKSNSIRSKLGAEIEEISREKKELEDECTSLSAEVAVVSSRAQELQTILKTKLEEANTAVTSQRETTNELNAIRRKAVEKTKSIAMLEHKLSEANGREQDTKQEARKYKEELDNALISRDKAEAACKLLQAQVDSFSHERIAQAKNMEEFGQLFDAMKSRHASEISMRQGTIDDLTIRNASIGSSVKRTLREKESIEEKYHLQSEEQENERAKVKMSIESLTGRISQAEAQLDDANKENRDLSQTQSEMEDRIYSLKEELDSERSNARREQERAENALKELRSLRHTYKDSEVKSERNISQMERDIQIAKERYRKKDADRQAEVVALREKLDEESMRYQQLIRHKNDLHQMQESKLSEERQVCNRLLERNKEINHSINILAAEKLELTRIASEAEDKVECLGHALNDAESKIICIGKELSESIQEHQERIVKERELKKELRDAETELDYTRKFSAAAAATSTAMLGA